MGYFDYPARITGKELFLVLVFLTLIALAVTVGLASKKRS